MNIKKFLKRLKIFSMGADKIQPFFSSSNGTRPEEGNHRKNDTVSKFVDINKTESVYNFNLGSITARRANMTPVAGGKLILDRFYSFDTPNTAQVFYERMRLTLVFRPVFATFFQLDMIKTDGTITDKDGIPQTIADVTICSAIVDNPIFGAGGNVVSNWKDVPLNKILTTECPQLFDLQIPDVANLLQVFINFNGMIPDQREFNSQGKPLYERSYFFVPTDKRFMLAGYMYKRTDREYPSYLQLGNLAGLQMVWPVETPATGGLLQWTYKLFLDAPQNEQDSILELFKMALQTTEGTFGYYDIFGSNLTNTINFFSKNRIEEGTSLYRFINEVKSLDFAAVGGVAAEFPQPEKWVILEAH